MKINIQLIRTLDPCKNSLDKVIRFYKNKEFTPRQFMGLKNISHEEKLWVAFRLISLEKVRFIADDIVDRAYSIFDDKNIKKQEKLIRAIILKYWR